MNIFFYYQPARVGPRSTWSRLGFRTRVLRRLLFARRIVRLRIADPGARHHLPNVGHASRPTVAVSRHVVQVTVDVDEQLSDDLHLRHLQHRPVDPLDAFHLSAQQTRLPLDVGDREVQGGHQGGHVI